MTENRCLRNLANISAIKKQKQGRFSQSAPTVVLPDHQRPFVRKLSDKKKQNKPRKHAPGAVENRRKRTRAICKKHMPKNSRQVFMWVTESQMELVDSFAPKWNDMTEKERRKLHKQFMNIERIGQTCSDLLQKPNPILAGMSLADAFEDIMNEAALSHSGIAVADQQRPQCQAIVWGEDGNRRHCRNRVAAGKVKFCSVHSKRKK